MSKLSLTQLVSAMQGKSLTYGWDAVTLYDQRKANELLFQLYVERFNTEDGYIEPVTMVMPWGGGDYKEHLYNLKLSAPWLSFENSDPAQPARARLTMDMVGGMIVSTKKDAGGTIYVSRMLQILPVGGPQLWMDQPVTKGYVSGVGNVVIDLNEAENFYANFGIGDLDSEEIGLRFKEYFENTLTPEQKRFSLGSLSVYENDVLTPENFEIRAMASDPLAVMGTENYGDGAVMMFITLREGQDCRSFPSNDSIYLIPADEGGTKYTGAMLLSSRVLFEKLIKPSLEKSIGEGLRLNTVTSGSEKSSSLEATAGGGSKDFTTPNYFWSNNGTPHVTNSRVNPLSYAFAPGFKVTAAKTALAVSWADMMSGTCYVPGFLTDYSYPFTFDYGVNVNHPILLDKETNDVQFGEGETSEEINITFQDTPGDGPDDLWNGDGERVTKWKMTEHAKELVRGALNKIELPSIKTFLLRNLLFPGHNALQLTEAFVPGDLAVFGQIDPLRTTTVLAPLSSTIEAGSTLQFSLTPMPGDVEWSVRDVDGELFNPGEISSKGLYSAPSQTQLPDSFVTVVVTAQGTLAGQPVQSSALVSVLHSTTVTNPLYDSCSTGDTLTLSAKSLGNSALQWNILTPQWGSTLRAIPGEPDKRTYTAGQNMDPDVPFPIDTIEVKNTTSNTSAYIYVSIKKVLTIAPMVLHESSDPESGAVRFELIGESGPIVPIPGAITITGELLLGEGTFDGETGTYTEPETVTPGSLAVISMTANIGGQINIRGYTTIPLPLSKYYELIEAVNQTILSA